MEPHILLDGARSLKEICVGHNISVAVAESLTAGLVGATLTRIPGASVYFRGGVICYDYSVKERILEVPREVIDTYGMVSRECVVAMARGVAHVCGARASIAVTGEAGPVSADAKVDIGTVWIAAGLDNTLVSREFRFFGNRDEIRFQTAIEAISLLYNTILTHPSCIV